MKLASSSWAVVRRPPMGCSAYQRASMAGFWVYPVVLVRVSSTLSVPLMSALKFGTPLGKISWL